MRAFCRLALVYGITITCIVAQFSLAASLEELKEKSKTHDDSVGILQYNNPIKILRKIEAYEPDFDAYNDQQNTHSELEHKSNIEEKEDEQNKQFKIKSSGNRENVEIDGVGNTRNIRLTNSGNKETVDSEKANINDEGQQHQQLPTIQININEASHGQSLLPFVAPQQIMPQVSIDSKIDGVETHLYGRQQVHGSQQHSSEEHFVQQKPFLDMNQYIPIMLVPKNLFNTIVAPSISVGQDHVVDLDKKHSRFNTDSIDVNNKFDNHHEFKTVHQHIDHNKSKDYNYDENNWFEIQNPEKIEEHHQFKSPQLEIQDHHHKKQEFENEHLDVIQEHKQEKDAENFYVVKPTEDPELLHFHPVDEAELLSHERSETSTDNSGNHIKLEAPIADEEEKAKKEKQKTLALFEINEKTLADEVVPNNILEKNRDEYEFKDEAATHSDELLNATDFVGELNEADKKNNELKKEAGKGISEEPLETIHHHEADKIKKRVNEAIKENEELKKEEKKSAHDDSDVTKVDSTKSDEIKQTNQEPTKKRRGNRRQKIQPPVNSLPMINYESKDSWIHVEPGKDNQGNFWARSNTKQLKGETKTPYFT